MCPNMLSIHFIIRHFNVDLTLAWKCKHFHLSLKRLVEELEEIRVALVQEKTDRKMKMVVEEMDARLANLFSLLNLGKFMGI